MQLSRLAGSQSPAGCKSDGVVYTLLLIRYRFVFAPHEPDGHRPMNGGRALYCDGRRSTNTAKPDTTRAPSVHDIGRGMDSYILYRTPWPGRHRNILGEPRSRRHSADVTVGANCEAANAEIPEPKIQHDNPLQFNSLISHCE